MERDPHISKLFRESGITPAPEGFTGRVMENLLNEAEKSVYKPLIGKKGRWLISLFILAVILVSLFWLEPGESGISRALPSPDWQWPEWNLNLNLNWKFLQDFKIGTGIAGALLAAFILVVLDAGIHRRRFVL